MFEKVRLFVIVHIQRRAGAVAGVVSCAYVLLLFLFVLRNAWY